MNNESSITALMSAFGRAYHAEHSKNPVFNDTMAKRLMTDDEYKRIGHYILGGMDFFTPDKKGAFENDEDALRYLVNTQIAPTPLARARFCEDSLKPAVRTGTRQYVILGAGLDSFAFREKALLEKITVFEVDHPLTQADKVKRIARAGLAVPENLIFVPCDFTKDSLPEKLTACGFDKKKKTFFSWLGVSYYLSIEEIEKLIENISSFATDGSSLLFDYAGCGLFLSEIKRVQNMIAMAKAGGEEMKSGFDYLSMDSLLARHGFMIYEHLDSNEIQNRYFAGIEKDLSAFEYINYVLAVIKK